jgi:methylenetetrahydrofolate reductase (NADPH)
VNNDFHKKDDLFRLFDGLVIKDFETEVAGTAPVVADGAN